MSGVAVEVKPEHLSSAALTDSFQQTISSQLVGGGSGGGGRAGGAGGHDTSFLSSFGPAGKSIMDTSDLNLGGPHHDLPSPYEFLVDLFGESLVQRLTAHIRNLSSTEEKKSTVKSDVSRKYAVQSGQPPSEDVLLTFLKREGFQPYKVQLPLKPMPRKPPAYHPWGRQLWRFQIPTSLLPVRVNVLDGWGKRSRMRSQRGNIVHPKYFRRHVYRGGIRTPHVHVVDLGAMWL